MKTAGHFEKSKWYLQSVLNTLLFHEVSGLLRPLGLTRLESTFFWSLAHAIGPVGTREHVQPHQRDFMLLLYRFKQAWRHLGGLDTFRVHHRIGI